MAAEKKKPSILAVDDVTMMLLIVQETLKDLGDIYVAKSGQMALRNLETIDVDLFLVDIQMPGMTGVELIRQIRAIEAHKKTPIIVISAKSDSDLLHEVVTYGIKDYVVKPFERDVLRSKVRHVLASYEK